jgi:hypothetical protein
MQMSLDDWLTPFLRQQGYYPDSGKVVRVSLRR